MTPTRIERPPSIFTAAASAVRDRTGTCAGAGGRDRRAERTYGSAARPRTAAAAARRSRSARSRPHHGEQLDDEHEHQEHDQKAGLYAAESHTWSRSRYTIGSAKP